LIICYFSVRRRSGSGSQSALLEDGPSTDYGSSASNHTPQAMPQIV